MANHPISIAIARKREIEVRANRPYPLVDLPVNGKILEPLIGRMHPVSSQIPASVDIAKYNKEGRPLPDPTKKNLRSRPIDVYAVSPVEEPLLTNTLRLLHDTGQMVRIGLRTDLPQDLADRHRSVPYTAAFGHGGVDPYTRASFPRWSYDFIIGQVRELSSETAVYLLRNPMHGQWLEEVAPDAPKRRGRPPKSVAATV